MATYIWMTAITLAVLVGTSRITVWTIRRDMARERARTAAYHEVIVANLQERAERLEIDLAHFKTPSTNGHRSHR